MSAFTKTGQDASLGKNSVANVVLPAPFGPAMIMIFRLATMTATYVSTSNLVLV
jgi:hypothetical protein